MITTQTRKWIKVTSVLMALLMLCLAVASCNNPGNDPETPTTDAPTEGPTENPTEAPTEEPTEAPTEEVTTGWTSEIMKDPEKAEKVTELLTLKQELRVDENGEFKVLVLSDVQHNVKEISTETINNIETIVRREKPDLVIFNGDNSFAINNVQDMKVYITNMTRYLEEREIPWAHVYGNHDGESNPWWQSLSKEAQQEIYEGFNHCVSKAGDADVFGVGNFVLPVLEYDSDKIAFNVWCLDSGAARGVYEDFPGQHVTVGNNTFFAHYEPMQQNQVDWFKETAALLAEYNGEESIPGMMAFHIPLQESYYAWNAKDVDKLDWTGEKRENVSAHAQDVPLFAAAKENKILAIVNSHDHINDFMVKYQGIRLCYTASIGTMEYHADDMLGGRVVKFSTANPDDVKTYMSYVNDRPEIDANSPILDLVINDDGTVKNNIVGRPTPTVVDYAGSYVEVIEDTALARKVLHFGRESSYIDDEPASVNIDASTLSNDFANGFAVELMFKVNSASFSSNYVGIVDHEEAGGWGMNLYKSTEANKAVLKAEFAYASAWNEIAYTVNIGEWYHAVMVYEGNTVSLYINGELIKTDTLSGSYRAPNFGTNCYICIGACAQQWRGDGGGKATGKAGFMGDIADVNIYVNPISAEEVAALYAAYNTTQG